METVQGVFNENYGVPRHQRVPDGNVCSEGEALSGDAGDLHHVPVGHGQLQHDVSLPAAVRLDGEDNGR